MKHYFNYQPDATRSDQSMIRRFFMHDTTIITFAVYGLLMNFYFENLVEKTDADQLQLICQVFYVTFGLYMAASTFAQWPLSAAEGNTVKVIQSQPYTFERAWDYQLGTLIVLLFWLSNNRNRFYVTVFLWPMLEVLAAFIADATLRQPEKRPRVMYLLILTAFNAYTLMNNAFGLEISLRTGGRTWGQHHDETPMFTGMIFGVHKMAFFILVSNPIHRLVRLDYSEWLTDLKKISLNSHQYSQLGSKLITIELLMGMVILSYFNQASQQGNLPMFMWFLCMLSTCFGLILSWCKHSIRFMVLMCKDSLTKPSSSRKDKVVDIEFK